MRAQFGAFRVCATLTLCGLFLVACASNGTNGAYVHPKARKAQNPPVAAQPTSPQLTPKAQSIPTPMQSSPNAPVNIDKAVGNLEARLPCNRRGGSPHCDLRIYQVNVGTFVDGSSDHNPVGGYGPGPHTGDIEGVIGALEHIKAMGFNTIWLTPIFDTKAGSPQLRPDGSRPVNTRLDGTGYFPRDYFKIDPQFGTLDSAQRLVDQAHSLGIKVLFDGVFGHHKGDLVPSPTGALPFDATRADAYDGAPASYPGRIVDYSDPRSTAFYKQVARHWIETLGIDGWRLDQVYQIPSQPLREINAEIKKAADAQLLSGYVVGEMWGTAEHIRNVLGPSDNPALMSAFDFPTRYALVQALASDENGGMNKPATTINEAWAMGAHQTYPDHAIMNLMLGNHDLVRFGDLIQRAGKGDPSSDGYWARHKMAFTFMAAWSGPITLYYGEEIGAEVGGFAAKVTTNCAASNQCDDHVGRNMVSIPGVNTRASTITPQARALKDYLTALMTLRSATPALSSGSRTHVYSDADVYIDLKSDGADRYLLVMNIGMIERQTTLTPRALAMTAIEGGTSLAGQIKVGTTAAGLALTLPALSAAIIKVEGS
jgi:cyclomaltodextrinase / maltogenic alpha-amylase / neopullulanase